MPHYDFTCSKCHTPTSRLCLFDERDQQACSCGNPLAWVFTPTRARAVVYCNDRDLSGNPEDGPPLFTGPRQKAQYLKDNGLVALGNEPLDGVRKWSDGLAAEEEEKAELALEKDLLEGLVDLGDALYTRDREAEPEPIMDEGRQDVGASNFVSWSGANDPD